MKLTNMRVTLIDKESGEIRVQIDRESGRGWSDINLSHSLVPEWRAHLQMSEDGPTVCFDPSAYTLEVTSFM